MARTTALLIAALAASSAGAQVLSAEGPAGACAVPQGIANSRPDPEGARTEVAIGVYVIDLVEVDDVEQTFTADLHLAASWSDPRLSAEARGHSLEGCRIGLNEVWHPNLGILNQRSVEKYFDETVAIDAAGGVLYRQRMYGTFSAPVDLREYPFDSQVLPVSVASLTPDALQIDLVVDDSRTGRMERLSVAGWAVKLGETRITSVYIAPQKRDLPLLDYRLIAKREPGFAIWKVLVPLALIVFMAWTVFWIDPSQLPPQVGVSTASVLTLIAFQFSLVYLLPRVSYLTRVDKFLLGSSLLVFFALGEAILTSRLAKSGGEGLARRIDAWARWIYAGLFAVITIVTLWL